ncbi:MAG: DNA polymerase Y family protein, partial [Planctomycetaceae bacterium]|nr:DNA polymerase Y family protein [Planctomycetaceae bacterium]
MLHSPLTNRLPQVRRCSSRATQQGIRTGLPLAEARVLLPTGWFGEHEPVADQTQLRELAWQCQRFTPRAGLEPAEEPESLWLDVTGCVIHFGDLPTLCRSVADWFEQQGFCVRIAAAPTWGAAWGVVQTQCRTAPRTHTASHSRSRAASTARRRATPRPRRRSDPPVTAPDWPVITTDALRDAVAQLPCRALRLPPQSLALLEECGLRQVGQLLSLPRSTLPARFGQELLLRIDQALGTAPELLTPELPPEPVRTQWTWEEPLSQPEEIAAALQQLLEQVLTLLSERQRVTQLIQVGWRTESKQRGELEVRLLRPSLCRETLWELLSLRLERMELPAGIVSLWVEAIPCRPDVLRRTTLFETTQENQREFLHLIERLTCRLGDQAVTQGRLLPDAQPELAEVFEPWNAELMQSAIPLEHDPAGMRPWRVFQVPLPVQVRLDPQTGTPCSLTWRNQHTEVGLCVGPERIATGWWRARMIRRDYYRLETI